jgi:hypothetical protein
MALPSQMGQGLFVVEALRPHSDTPHSVGLLWTSDQPDSETSIWQRSTLTRDRYPCPRRDSKPQFQQMSVRTPTPQAARPLGSAEILSLRKFNRTQVTNDLMSNVRSFLNVVCFILGNSPASEFYMPIYKNSDARELPRRKNTTTKDLLTRTRRSSTPVPHFFHSPPHLTGTSV